MRGLYHASPFPARTQFYETLILCMYISMTRLSVFFDIQDIYIIHQLLIATSFINY
jgi:hypothetical protein